MNKNNPPFFQKHSALIKAIIVSSSMLSLNAYTSTVSTEKVEPIPVTEILSNPLAESLYEVPNPAYLSLISQEWRLLKGCLVGCYPEPT